MSAPPSSPPPLSLLPESTPDDEVVVPIKVPPPGGVVPPPAGVLATGDAVGGAATAGMAVGDGRGTAVGSPVGLPVVATPERLMVVTPLATEAVSTSALARDEAWLTKAADASVAETEVPSAAWSFLFPRFSSPFPRFLFLFLSFSSIFLFLISPFSFLFLSFSFLFSFFRCSSTFFACFPKKGCARASLAESRSLWSYTRIRFRRSTASSPPTGDLCRERCVQVGSSGRRALRRKAAAEEGSVMLYRAR
mmetsp:Transcript_39604/g.67373  ORF Transcript_39604/g.67373 Transcript_39604/m.67373 type:complete len:250 (+) Transcript_39604:486-1235(+)